MNKIDIILPAVIIGFVIGAGIFFLSEWQEEQIAYSLLSDEDKAMTQLAENLRKTNKTDCSELSRILPQNTNQIMIDAIHNKQIELGCKSNVELGEVSERIVYSNATVDIIGGLLD